VTAAESAGRGARAYREEGARGEANLEAIRRWSDTFRDRGFEAALAMVDEIFDPEVEFSPLLARELEGRTYRGHDGLRDFFSELNEMLGGVHYEPAEYEPVADDVIVLLTRIIGTGRGSAVPIGQDLCMVYEFRDGLVRRMTAYSSREEAFEVARKAARA
jgi:ketosteroid isomerase-like protein